MGDFICYEKEKDTKEGKRGQENKCLNSDIGRERRMNEKKDGRQRKILNLRDK